ARTSCAPRCRGCSASCSSCAPAPTAAPSSACAPCFRGTGSRPGSTRSSGRCARPRALCPCRRSRTRGYGACGGASAAPRSPAPFADRLRLLRHHIYGVDVDPQAVLVSRLALLLMAISGPQPPPDLPTLPDLGHNLRCGEALVGLDFRAAFPEVFAGPQPQPG